MNTLAKRCNNCACASNSSQVHLTVAASGDFLALIHREGNLSRGAMAAFVCNLRPFLSVSVSLREELSGALAIMARPLMTYNFDGGIMVERQAHCGHRQRRAKAKQVVPTVTDFKVK